MKAIFGQKIICSSGHVCGVIQTDVNDGAAISPQDFHITAGASVQNGYACDRCRAPIAVIDTGRWRISTERGWLT